MQVLLFGQLAEITGSNSIDVPAVADTDELKAVLFQRYPLLEQSKFIIAVNQQITRQNISLTNNEAIALMPPFSGG